MSSIQRSLNTLQYYIGTQNGVLITEVSAIQKFVIERFHYNIYIRILLNYVQHIQNMHIIISIAYKLSHIIHLWL